MLRCFARATLALIFVLAAGGAHAVCNYRLTAAGGPGNAAFTATNIGDTTCLDGAIAGPIQDLAPDQRSGQVTDAAFKQWAVVFPMGADELPAKTDCTDLIAPFGAFECHLKPGVTIAPGESFAVRLGLLPSNESADLCLLFGVGHGRPTGLPPMLYVAPEDATPADNWRTMCRTAAPGYPVTKSDSADPVLQGSTFAYTITVTNTYNTTIANAQIVDTLPAGLVPLSVAATDFACSIAGQTVTCNQTSPWLLNDGDDIVITVQAASAGSFTNICTATNAGGDPQNPDDSLCNEMTTVVPLTADLDCTKTDATDPVAAGGAITYNIACNNAGPQDAANVSFADTLPAAVTFVSASGSGWSCSHVAGVVTCTRPTAAVGALPGIQIVANAPLAGGTVTNTCVIAADTNDPTPADPNCNEDTTVDPPIADLDCTKTDATDPVAAGGRDHLQHRVQQRRPAGRSERLVR
jgi:uncharacterized repeat protein (TIGR01451 family)